MNLPDLSVYFTELLFCALLIVAVRTLGGRWLGPGARRLLWTLLILKALVPFTLPTAYHPLRISEVALIRHPRAGGDLESERSVPLHSLNQELQVEHVQENIGVGSLGPRLRGDDEKFSTEYVLFAVWFLGFLTLLGVAVGRNRTIIGRATKNPIAVPDWVQTIFLDCRETLRLGTWPVLIVSPYVPTPCLVGAVRPRILIPESLIEQRNEENEKRVRFLLLHELVHLKQGDIWLAWLWTLALAVHWFNPLFWIFGRFLKFDCETACDDRVLTILEQKERRDYGRSLIEMMIELCPCATNPGVARGISEIRCSTPGSLCVVETRSNIERRLIMMKSYKSPTLLRNVSACVVFLLLGAFCLTSYAEPKPPISAEKAKWMGYVEDFFMNNYRDITMRKSLAWGDPKTDDKGNVSITYKYDALIWDKERVVIEDQFTFDKNGKFVDVKKLSKEPESVDKPAAKKPDAAASRKKAQEGWKCFMQGNSPEGEPLFLAATELDPKNANAWQGLGWTQWAQGKGDEAKKTFETCLTLDKKNVAAINGLGQIAQSEGNTDKAIEYWIEGTKLDPRATGPMAALAAVYDGKDDYPNAIKYYEMWLRAEPNNDDAKAALKKVKEKAAKK